MAFQLHKAVEQDTERAYRLVLVERGVYLIAHEDEPEPMDEPPADAKLDALARGANSYFIPYPQIQQTEYDSHSLRLKTEPGDFRFSFPDVPQDRIDQFAQSLQEGLRGEWAAQQ